MTRAMNPIYVKEIMMGKKNVIFLSSILVLISFIGGCVSQEELKIESEQLFIIPTNSAEKGWRNQVGENSHIIKASDYYNEQRGYNRKPLLNLSDTSNVIGLLFDLSNLPKNIKIKKATLCLCRIELTQSRNLYINDLRIKNPELFFNNMVLGNVNSAYGYVKSEESKGEGYHTFEIIEAQIQDVEENILDTLVRIDYEISGRLKEHRKLAESTRKAPVWITGEPLSEGGFLGWSKMVRYRDLIHYFMENKIYRAWHEGKWDFFDVTNSVERDYNGDQKLLLVMMQYPKVLRKNPIDQLLLMAQAEDFSVTWASPDNTSEVAPQILVEFEADTNVSILEPDETKSTDTKSSLQEQLGKLKEIFDEGIITKEEYESRRQSIIDKFLD